MFGDLFVYPKVLARHRAGPSADARERFLAHCAGYRAVRGPLLRLANELLVVAERIDVNSGFSQNPRSDGGTSPTSWNSCAAYSQLIMWRFCATPQTKHLS
jgi:hypothetical protein